MAVVLAGLPTEPPPADRRSPRSRRNSKLVFHAAGPFRETFGPAKWLGQETGHNSPDAQGVMATPIDHPFEVQATWGKLSGTPGDFLLKNFSCRETAFPDDVWIVDQTLFRPTNQVAVDGQ